MKHHDSPLRAQRSRWLSLALVTGSLAACAQERPTDPNMPPTEGQSDFVSAPVGGMSVDRGGSAGGGGADASASLDASAPSPMGGGEASGAGAPRQIEETDLYRVDGNRLYVLNGYRGLLVFDITNVDHPRLLGRAPLFGQPVDMVVRGGVAYAIVADWYGADDDGAPFYGSVVYAIDARDAANPRLARSARIRGWIRDARVVGDVLYAVSDGYETTTDPRSGVVSSSNQVAITSVRIASPESVAIAGQRVFSGYSGIFNVTANAILMAHSVETGGSWDDVSRQQSQIDYVDISDPNGAINLRGSIRVSGMIQGWGANNGRFNIDFDGRYVRALAMQYGQTSDGRYQERFLLNTVDASDPNRLAAVTSLTLATEGWSPAARFDRGRMYLSPQGGWGETTSTPVQVWDVSNPAAPRLAGSASVEGQVWNFIPAGDRLFALGSRYDSSTPRDPYGGASHVALRYLDVHDPAAPRVLGVSEFGSGWAWTPAAGDFKAFTMDASRGLVVLPFSGWDYRGRTYQNGLQLIEFSPETLRTAGTARTRGWVERGVLVRDRLFSLSDTALSVVDYTNRDAPRTVNELTLARNVMQTQPWGEHVVELETDWYDHEQSTTLRVLPARDPDDAHLGATVAELTLRGTAPRMYRHGDFAYVLTTETVDDPGCGGGGYPYGGCTRQTGRVQVIDLSDVAHPRARGSVELPSRNVYYWGCFGGWGYYGWYGWWDGDSVVQAGNALALREQAYGPYYSGSGSNGQLHVIDLANPDRPSLASIDVLPASTPFGWWGGLSYNRANAKLFLTHYEVLPAEGDRGRDRVRYYLDEVNLDDRAHPRVVSRVNIPGVFVGSSNDGRYGYTVDYRWNDRGEARNSINVVEFASGRAFLRSRTEIDGNLGRVLVQNDRLYFNSEYATDAAPYTFNRRLHVLDVHDPRMPVDRSGRESRSYGYLLGLEGDVALVAEGSGSSVELYRLVDDRAPQFIGTERTRGWWANNIAREGDTLFLSAGYWGVQTIPLR